MKSLQRPTAIFLAVLVSGALASDLALASGGGATVTTMECPECHEIVPLPVTTKGSGDKGDLFLMIAYATVAIGFSFLCSIAEAVVLSVTPSYVANLKNQGKASAERLQKVKHNIDRTLAAILTLNTIAHTVGSGGAGAYAAKYYGQASVGIAMAILTLLILFLSEIIPKTLGATYWRTLAPITARFVQLLTVVLYPLIFVSEIITKMLTGGKRLHGMTRDEFTALADIGAAGGQLDVAESQIVKNLLKFPDLQAADIMTPSTVVYAMQQDRTVQDVMDEIKVASFSRIPVYGENRDDVTGFVLKTDILLNEQQNEGKAKLRDLKRELMVVRHDTSLSQVLEILLDNRAHIILVVDRYGGMQGLVTLEDVVETLIGIEIVDEVDKIDDMRKLARAKWEERMERVGINVRGPHGSNAANPDTAPTDSTDSTAQDGTT